MSNWNQPEEAPVEDMEVEQVPETLTEPDVSEEVGGQVAALEEALAAEKDRSLRLAAEYDNFRKRSQKEREAEEDGIILIAGSDTCNKASSMVFGLVCFFMIICVMFANFQTPLL